ncbi:lipase member K [Sus scrofa]|uniref:lipase member K n=1 Tax=Sus scrofa TaxID=9823 RepID=UPI000A2B03C9|nr:lipase member K [Sus scrofa]
MMYGWEQPGKYLVQETLEFHSNHKNTGPSVWMKWLNMTFQPQSFILEKTGQEQLYYVGHSQGTTIAFVAFSTNPELAKRIKYFLHWLSHHSEIHPMSSETINSSFQRRSQESLGCYLAQSHAGTSVQNMLHWAQAVNSGRFQAFDWGNPYQNMMHFHQLTPPLYNVSKMEVPTAVWSGGQDRVADLKDVENLLPKITRLIYYKLIPHYNHVDFYLGQDAPHEIYQDLIRLMEGCFQN